MDMKFKSMTSQTNDDKEFSQLVHSSGSNIEDTVIHNTPCKNQAFCQNTFKATQDDCVVSVKTNSDS